MWFLSNSTYMHLEKENSQPQLNSLHWKAEQAILNLKLKLLPGLHSEIFKKWVAWELSTKVETWSKAKIKPKGIVDFKIFQKDINRYMYIPYTSGHVFHTIKNYVLGEIKRYIRYNSLKLSFLKISTQFFLRLRNRGFKKVWLRRLFAILKYEVRQKLMENSHISDPEYQVVLETEAEGLMARDLDKVLEEESPETRTKIVPTFPPYLPGRKDLC